MCRSQDGSTPLLVATRQGHEPGHQELCDAELAFVARAIAGDLDLTRHMQDAVQSLAVCLAADESVRSGAPVKL